jgi:hypothetical protein
MPSVSVAQRWLSFADENVAAIDACRLYANQGVFHNTWLITFSTNRAGAF